MMKKLSCVFGFLFFGSLISASLPDGSDGSVEFLPFDKSDEISLPVFLRDSPKWAMDKLETMTLEEKIAQSFMVEVSPVKGEKHLKTIDSLINHYKIGGLIMFQGSVEQAKSTIERMQEQSEIPLLIGIDGEWGSNMRLNDGERFPFQLTMGAANQLGSTRIIANAMGKEMRELGVHINFSPVVDININPQNPVIGFRSFGENPLSVSNHAVEMIKGMQEYHVLACMKHFPGHGDTDVDSHLDLPTVKRSKVELLRNDWLPYRQGRLAGAAAVMIGHLNVPALDDSGLPATLSPIIIKKILRKELKFDGLVISDALNMKALTKRFNDVEIAKQAYLAGNDILLYPSKVKEAVKAIKAAVENGEITEEEVNEKTIRILRAKYFSIQLIKDKILPELSDEAVEFAKINIYEKALVVLKNDNAIPVIDVSGKNLILNIGGRGSSFNEMSRFYTQAEISSFKTADEAWQKYGNSFTEYQHIYINLIAPSVLPKNDYNYPKGWRELLKKLPKSPKIYVTFFGNPYTVKDKYSFENVDAVILAFQNTIIGQNRAAQLIFGGFQANSVMPVTLSVDYQEGFGLVTDDATRLKFTVPWELGVTDSLFSQIDSIAIKGIKEKAFPGCQIVVAKDGKVIYQKAFGKQTYNDNVDVNNHTIYDLASITKIAASTLGLMYLQDQNQFSLDSTLGTYLEELTKGTAYQKLKMRDIMTHQAGLISWIPFYKATLINGIPDSAIYSEIQTDSKAAVVAEDLYLKTDYEDEMLKIILGKSLQQKKYKYSDLGYYFVKQIIEQQAGLPLNKFVSTRFYEPMGLTSMGYLPLERFEVSQISPTEKDNYYRYQTIQGYVHDMGAAMTNGVGGHAGLFSNATDLAGYMQMLLNKGVYGGKRYLSEKVIEEYTSCQYCPSNRRGAGFDKPVLNGAKGPTTENASKISFGHTGFTGTMTWSDPKNGINYVFLSNRTFPDAENWKITKMNIRTDIQKVIYDAFK